MAELVKAEDGDYYVAETIDWRSDDPHATLKIGVSQKAIKAKGRRGTSWSLGQLYGPLATGLINVKHIFEGVRRSLCVGEDMAADQRKLVFTWNARYDARLTIDGRLEKCAAPLESVFFVHISPNGKPDDFPEVFGWAEHWGWVDADSKVVGAPIDFMNRYDRRLWSRD